MSSRAFPTHSKGGRGNRQNVVHDMYEAGKSSREARDFLKAAGYSKSRQSQLMKAAEKAHAQNKRDELPTNMSEEGVVSGSFPPAQAKVSSPEPASKHQAMIMKPTLRTIVISDAAKSWTHDMWNDSASRHRFPLEINNSVNLSSYRGYLIERCKANATIDAYMQGLII